MRKITAGIIFGVVVTFAMGIAIAGDYDDYVQLSANDDDGSPSFHTAGKWKKNGIQETQGPHPGESYFVPKSRELYTTNITSSTSSPLEYVFGGDELVVEGMFCIRTKRSGVNATDATVRVGNLKMLEGGYVLHSSPTPAVLAGACTVMGTSAKPSEWRANSDSALKAFCNLDFIGEPGSAFYFHNNKSGAVTYCYGGDASRFLGTMRLDDANSILYDNTPSGMDFPGTVSISGGGTFQIPDGKTAAIGMLFSDGGRLSFGGAGAHIAVTNDVNANGVAIQVDLDHAYSSGAETIPLVTLAPIAAGTLSVDDFQLSYPPQIGFEPLRNYPAAFAQVLKLAVTNELDGSQTLSVAHRNIVWQDDSDADRASSFMLPANAAHLSDDSEIAATNDYFICGGKNAHMPDADMSFGGGSLTIYGSGTCYFQTSKTITVDDFRWVASGASNPQLQTYSYSPVLSGNVTVVEVPDSTFRVQMYNVGSNNNKFTISAGLAGNGTLDFILNPAASSDPRASYVLSGLNTNFTGRIRVYHNPFSSANAAKHEAAPDAYCVMLAVSDQRNLGGARESFDAQSLVLATHSLLKTVGSVVFDEPTRGWFVEDVGRVSVDAGETLTITNKQITYAGEFRKEGTGSLKLGGTARFTSEALETPLAGTNVLKIAGGAFTPTDVTCCDGLSINFAAGAKLVLDASTTGDLKTYGLYDVKWDVPITVEGGAALPIEFDLPDDFNRESRQVVGICTVSPTAAANMSVDDFDVAPIDHMLTEISRVDNMDGEDNITSVTFVCSMCPRRGLAIIVR